MAELSHGLDTACFDTVSDNVIKLFKRTHVVVVKKNTQEEIVYKRRWHLIAIIFLLWSVYGLFSITPLTWKEAFGSMTTLNRMWH
jgi:hypothetical protein